MKKNLVSIVLLNWNGEQYIFDCIESLFNQSYNNFELIVVDNASTDGSIGEIEKMYSFLPNVVIIKNTGNMGYSKGMNIGISVAKGDFVLLLNLDVYLDEQYIEKCISQMFKDECIGFVGGPEYIWTKEKKRINEHGPASGPLFIKKRIQLFTDKNLLNQSCYCFGVTGSFPLIRKETLEDIKSVSGYYFDENFGTGWEDTDMRFRAFLRGWKSFYLSDAIGYHVGSSSAEGVIRLIDKPIEYQERIFRNRYYVINKSIPIFVQKKIYPYLIITEILLYPYYFLRSKKSLKALLKAKKEVKNNKTKLLEKKNKIESNILIEEKELMSMFKKF